MTFPNTIILQITDPQPRSYTSYVYSFQTEHKDADALYLAIRNACQEYIETEDGKTIYEQNNKSFNFGDLYTYVPRKLCEKHGFYLDKTIETLELDFNTQLVIDPDDE